MMPRTSSGEPRRAYSVEESTKGITYWLVYANSAADAAENVRLRRDENAEAIDTFVEPSGIHRVRRAPGEDR